MKKLYRTLMFMVLALVSACATDSGLTRSEKLARNEQLISQFIDNNQITNRSSITSFRYHGWSEIDDQYLILESSPNRYYLIKLHSYCDGLRFANAITINQSGIGLSEKFDSIRPLPNHSYDCSIEKIYPIDREQKQKLLSELSALDEKAKG